jgi:hypothetical protein
MCDVLPLFDDHASMRPTLYFCRVQAFWALARFCNGSAEIKSAALDMLKSFVMFQRE